MAAIQRNDADGGTKGFKPFESLGDNDANDLHGSDSSDEEERALNESENNNIVFTVGSRFMQIGRENVLKFRSVDSSLTSENPSNVDGGDEAGPVLIEHWKPKGLLNVGRTRSGFPDLHEDHLVQLLVCKNQQTREALDIGDKYAVKVAVSYDRAGGYSLKTSDYDCERITSESLSDTDSGSMPIGVVGYLFRFYEPDTKYKITFSLKAILPTKMGKRKRADRHIACEPISEISVTLETGARTSPKSGKTSKKRPNATVSPSYVLNSTPLSGESMVLYKRSSWIVNQLQSRRENARWVDFDKYASDLLLKFTDADSQITIKLEQSVGAYYQKKLERSLQLINESVSMLPLANNQHLLAARGYGYQAGIFRNQGSIGTADYYVQLAEQNIAACQTSLDTSLVAYERASVLIDFIGRTPHRSVSQVNEALRNLEKCIDVCERVESKNRHLSVMKHHFLLVLVKMTTLLLDCRTEAGRKRAVSEEFVTKAKACLDKLSQCWSDMAPGDRISFCLASSDLEYRRSNYAEAVKFASLAKDVAEEMGFNLQISHAQKCLDHLRAITSGGSSITSGQRHYEASFSSDSEGDNGDVSSSGSESDWLCEILN